MTVSELIKVLEGCDKDSQVIVATNEGTFYLQHEIISARNVNDTPLHDEDWCPEYCEIYIR